MNTNSRTVIGLGGLLRSGKDTIADHLVSKHGYTKIGMSDALLDMLLTLDPLVPAQTEHGALIAQQNQISLDPIVHVTTLWDAVEHDYTELKTNREVRRLLQVLGTDIGRDMIDPDLWVDIASRKIAAVVEGGGKAVLTGLRFPNEKALIEGVWRGTAAWVRRPSNAPQSVHASENSVSSIDFDLVLENDGTLEQLYALADKHLT